MPAPRRPRGPPRGPSRLRHPAHGHCSQLSCGLAAARAWHLLATHSERRTTFFKQKGQQVVFDSKQHGAGGPLP